MHEPQRPLGRPRVLAAVTPLADLLFGTMRRSLTAEELAVHGPLAEAKATPVGACEPARLVARPRAASRTSGALVA